MKKHYRHENDCLNCGTILAGKFCHSCGQENLEIRESFGHMMNHAISDYFHFDHQFFHTLRPLFLNPGMLTNEYMAGRRAQFLHPVKMYIFISLVYFVLAFQDHQEERKVEQKQVTTNRVEDAIKREITSNIKKDSNLTPAQKQEALQNIGSFTGYHITTHIKSLTSKHPAYGAENKYGSAVTTTTNDTTYTEYLVNQNKLTPDKRDGWLTRYYNQKAFALNDPNVNKVELIKEGIKHNFPKMMFLLLPLFALILRIAFWENHKYYVEHLIYSFHLHCFIFLYLSFFMLIQMILPVAAWHAIYDWVTILEGLVIIWYLYRSLRVVYNRSRWRTLSKLIGVSFAYSVVFIFCLTILVLVTAATVV